MKDFNIGPIVLLLLFILIPLANYILDRMRRRFESRGPRQPMPDPGMRRHPAPPLTGPAPAQPRERSTTTPPATFAYPSSRRRWSRGALFRTKNDVRRTIVAMTILGPCRAYDPPG